VAETTAGGHFGERPAGHPSAGLILDHVRNDVVYRGILEERDPLAGAVPRGVSTGKQQTGGIPGPVHEGKKQRTIRQLRQLLRQAVKMLPAASALIAQPFLSHYASATVMHKYIALLFNACLPDR